MKTNRGRFYEYKAISFIIYLLPLIVLFSVNYGSYIRSAGTSLSFFGYIIIAMILIAFKDKFLEFAKKNVVLSVSLVVFIVSIVMQYLAQELMLISGVSLFGAFLSCIVEPVADVYHVRAEKEKAGEVVDVPTHKNAWRLAYGLRAEEEHVD